MRIYQSTPGLKKDSAPPYASPHFTLMISPKKLALVLTLVVLSLIIAHVTVEYIRFFQGHDVLLGFERLLNLNYENNIPTWYSSSALLLSAMLLAVIALVNKREGKPYTLQWFVLAAIFLYLSLDEAASLHESMGSSLEPMLETIGYFHGFLYFSWVIFGAIFVLFIALAFVRFLVSLAVQTRSLFLIAGTMYVGGALGIELLESRHYYIYGHKDFSYMMLVTVEEGLEMLGVVVFLYALLSHLGSSMSGMQILVENGAPKHTPHIAVEISSPKDGREV